MNTTRYIVTALLFAAGCEGSIPGGEEEEFRNETNLQDISTGDNSHNPVSQVASRKNTNSSSATTSPLASKLVSAGFGAWEDGRRAGVEISKRRSPKEFVDDLVGADLASSLSANDEGELRAENQDYLVLSSGDGSFIEIRNRARSSFDLPEGVKEISEEEALNTAKNDLAKLELSASDGFFKQEIKVSELRAIDSESPTAERRLAYKIFVESTLDGVRVEGPRAVLSYYLDGTLHKVRISRPELVQGTYTQSPILLDVAEQKLQEVLSNHPLGKYPLEEISLRRNLIVENGILTPAVIAKGLLRSEIGSGRWGEAIVRFPEKAELQGNGKI